MDDRRRRQRSLVLVQLGVQTFDNALIFADNVPLDPDGPGGNPPLTGYDSYLMTITTREEQAFVNAHPDNSGFRFWIALSDAAAEGTFRWVARAAVESGRAAGPGSAAAAARSIRAVTSNMTVW